MDKNKGLGGIIFAGIFIIVAAVLASSVADNQVAATQANTVTNESVTLINATAVSLDNNQLDSITSVVNATNASDTLALGVGYTANLEDGTITSLGRSGNWNVTYVWREVGDSTARTLTDLVTLFFVLGAFLFAVGMLFKDNLRELMDRF